MAIPKLTALEQGNIANSNGADVASSVNQLIDGLADLDFNTLALAVASETFDTAGGQSIYLDERTTGNGGGAHWKTIIAGATPDVDLPNTFDIVQCTGVPTLALVLAKDRNNSINSYGNDRLSIQFALTKQTRPQFLDETYSFSGGSLFIGGIVDANNQVIDSSDSSNIANTTGGANLELGRFTTTSDVYVPLTTDVAGDVNLFEMSSSDSTFGVYAVHDSFDSFKVENGSFSSIRHTSDTAAVRIGNDVAGSGRTRTGIHALSNVITDISTDDASRCWGISAFGEHCWIMGNDLTNVGKGLDNLWHRSEGIYTKTREGFIGFNILLDCGGRNDGADAQGAISVKGSEGGGGDSIGKDNIIPPNIIGFSSAYSAAKPAAGLWIEAVDTTVQTQIVSGCYKESLHVPQGDIHDISVKGFIAEAQRGLLGVNIKSHGVNQDYEFTVKNLNLDASLSGTAQLTKIQSLSSSGADITLRPSLHADTSDLPVGVTSMHGVSLVLDQTIEQIRITDGIFDLRDNGTGTLIAIICQGGSQPNNLIIENNDFSEFEGTATNIFNAASNLPTNYKWLNNKLPKVTTTNPAIFIDALRLPIADNTTVSVEATITARGTIADESASWKIAATVSQDAGSPATVIGTLTKIHEARDTAAALFDVQINPSTNLFDVEIKGANGVVFDLMVNAICTSS